MTTFFIILGILNLISTSLVVYNNIYVQKRNQDYWHMLEQRWLKKEKDLDVFVIDMNNKLTEFMINKKI